MAKWKRLLDNISPDFPHDKPVFMTNLLQFYDKAQYPEGSKHPSYSSQEAWLGRYISEFQRLATEAGSFKIVYLSLPTLTIVSEDSEKWDIIILVKYLSIKIFYKTFTSNDYTATALEHHGTGLQDWKLIASTQVIIPE
ncbi:hypothetical protein ASPBRDRAFT_35412 [Aspergillus brasiliensis CBS 101740]|uniref:Uncharacterized protein n=1 Tax=Aspergillus brasiliensis (strain CBS 101740 / IMI 381727 / IBT 21946) TaxID=767769 RepID=A0A1L9U2W4_ASPBC|nr:hypothetical protein ASPBRDRAFT_35412 [Aspergillus brasiliensis CBS 101740]